MSKRLLVRAAVLLALGFSGCQHHCQRPCARIGQPGCAPCAAGTVVAPPSPDRIAPQPVLQVPPEPAPVQAPDPVRRYEPPLAVPGPTPTWRPSPESQTQLGSSNPSSPEPPRPTTRLQSPDFSAPADVKPATAQEPAASPSLPVGIPQFATIKDQVASGLDPLLDGLDWLKDNSFRTVLHIHKPGDDETAARRLMEKRGLKYSSIEFSPTTLSKTQVEQFIRTVDDPANLPLFVYDKDGSLAGGLWYLYFRISEHAPDAEARTRAARYGLKADAAGEHRLIWLAIQKYLSEQIR